MTKLRIGFGRIAQETNSYSALPTSLDDFRRFHWLEGHELMAACEPSGRETEIFLRNAELSGMVKGARAAGGDRIELVPLVSAWAIPGGPLTKHCLRDLIYALAGAIDEAGKLDGIMLSMHGAMGAFGTDDPEADVIEAVRKLVGDDLPIAVSLDLHAQLHRRFVEPVDIIAAYRTNPHRDHARVGERTGAMLARTVLGEIQPTMAWRSLPMLTGGGTTIDLLRPMRAIYKWMKDVEKEPGVLYVSQFNAHLWNDSQDLGWACTVVTDGDQALAERLADELAQKLWDVRKHGMPEFPDAQTAIERARAASWRRRFGVVTMSDASDVVAAGAPGENTRLVRALLEQAPDLRSLAPIRDDAAVAELWDQELGSEVSVTVGGRLTPETDPALAVTGTLRARARNDAVGRMVAVDAGHLQLVITDGPPIAMKPEFYTAVGLSPWKADVVVVKSLFPFRFYFLPHNRLTMYVKTAGVTDFDVGLANEHRTAVWPKDDLDDWRAIDRARRLE